MKIINLNMDMEDLSPMSKVSLLVTLLTYDLSVEVEDHRV